MGVCRVPEAAEVDNEYGPVVSRLPPGIRTTTGKGTKRKIID